MKSILEISNNEFPISDEISSKNSNLYNYSKLFAINNKVEILSFKTRDKTKIKNITFDGFSNKNITPKLRSFLNLLFYKKYNTIDIIFSASHEEVSGIFNVIFSKVYHKKSLVRMAGNLVDAYKFKKTLFNRCLSYLVNNLIAIKIIKNADLIIVMSQYLKDELIKRGYNKDKIKMIMQPLEYNYFQLKKSEISRIKNLKLSKNKKNILFAGNLTKGKGIDSFLYLLKDKKINQKFNFIFAGKDIDNYFPKLKKYKNVTLLGKISKNELIKYYYKADLFLFPSYFEGFPRVVTEAFATGCPIITRNIVNLDRLADNIFNSDNELKELLLNFNYTRKDKIYWPKEFEENYIKNEYLKLIDKL